VGPAVGTGNLYRGDYGLCRYFYVAAPFCKTRPAIGAPRYVRRHANVSWVVAFNVIYAYQTNGQTRR
jgi:hypothetical protein